MNYKESIFNVKTSSQILRNPANMALKSRQHNGETSKQQATYLNNIGRARSMRSGENGFETVIDSMDCKVISTCDCKRSICILESFSKDELSIIKFRFNSQNAETLETSNLCEFALNEKRQAKTHTKRKVKIETKREKNSNGILKVKVIKANPKTKTILNDDGKYQIKVIRPKQTTKTSVNTSIEYKELVSKITAKITNGKNEKVLLGLDAVLHKITVYRNLAKDAQNSRIRRNFTKLADKLAGLLL